MQPKPWNNSRNSYLPMQNSVSKKNWACELQGREQAGIARLKRLAKIRLFASFGQLIYKESRGLNRRQISELLTGTYLNKRQNILITGPTGAGKIYLACALGEQACNQQISVRYSRLSRLLRCNRYIYMHVNLYTVNTKIFKIMWLYHQPRW